MTFWQGKRVLVTGAGGFIGSHVTEALVRSGAKVRAMVHYNSRNDWGMLEACLRLAGRAIPVRQDPARLRITDVETVVGDARRLRTVTGWQPAISWQRSLADSWQWLRTGRGGT